MDEITPVFICGMGRSGTTNALRVLNTHPSVMLNGEISLSVLKNFFALIDGVDRSYGTKDKTSAGWSTRKAEYMFESFGYLAKGGRGRQTKVPQDPASRKPLRQIRTAFRFDRAEAALFLLRAQPLRLLALLQDNGLEQLRKRGRVREVLRRVLSDARADARRCR
jgi:hypothetical protein